MTSQGSSARNIDVITEWPGNAAGYFQKVPSQIAYKSENPSLDRDIWGYEIPPNATRYSWTKLLLDQRARASEFDDPTLSASGWGGQTAPGGKAPGEVVSDYLSHFYKHCMEHLEKRMTPGVLKVTPIEFWFTMPAIWSDEAQHATKSAAERAGFGRNPSRDSDTISMITEPEAAALAALKITAEQYDDLMEVTALTGYVGKRKQLMKTRVIPGLWFATVVEAPWYDSTHQTSWFSLMPERILPVTPSSPRSRL